MPAAPRRRRLAVALAAAAVVGGAGGLTVSVLTPVSYTATGKVYVSTQPSSTADLQTGAVFAQQVSRAWAAEVSTPLVLQPVITELQLHTTVAALASRVRAHTLDDTVLIQIEATDPSAIQAARIANAVQDRLVAVGPSLTPVEGSANPSGRLASVSRATPSSAQTGPSALVLALSGALAGVLVWALVIALLLIQRRPPRPPGQPAPSML